MTTDIQAKAKKAHEVLRACWVLVSTSHRDSVADDVERMGKALAAALEAKDWAQCDVVIEEARVWLKQFAGVVMTRGEYVFEAAVR